MASVKLIIFAGRKLPGVDGGSADPYVTVIHNAQKLFRTKEKKRTTSPVWNQEFDIPRVRRTDVITLNVKDGNTFGGSTMIGSCKINLAAIEPNVPGEKCWAKLLDGKPAEAGELQYLVTYKDPNYVPPEEPAAAAIPGLHPGLAGADSGASGRGKRSSLTPGRQSIVGGQIVQEPDSLEAEDLDPALFTIVLGIVEARGLPALGRHGLSDPYVQIKIEGVGKKKTEPKHDTLEPKWNDLLAFDGITKGEEVEVKIKHSGTLSDKDMGSCTLRPGSLALNESEDKWHPLVGDSGNSGEIRIVTTKQVNKSAQEAEKARVTGGGFNINPFGKNKDDDEDLDDGDGEEKGDHDADDQGKTGRYHLEPKDDLPPPKPGKYTLQVHIVEAKHLAARDSGGTSDPICTIEAFGQKKHTKRKDKMLNCVWNEFFYLEHEFTSAMQLSTEFINISVFDVNTFSPNVIIGSYMFECALVYKLENHEVFETWVGLWDPSGEFEGLQGYLKLSLCLLHEEDEQAAHEDDPDDEGDGDDDVNFNKCLMPPTLEQELHLLKFHCYQAEHLPKTDNFAMEGQGCDPFAAVKFGGSPLVRSKHVKSNQTPLFKETLVVPVMVPTMNDFIEFSMWDRDPLSNDRIATHWFSFKDIQANPDKYKNPDWYNFYGCPSANQDAVIGRKARTKKLMDLGKIPGSQYLGRVLLAIESGKAPNGTKPKCSKRGEFRIMKPTILPKTQHFTLRVDVLELCDLPLKDKLSGEKVFVKMRWGNLKSSSKIVAVSHACAVLYEAFPDITLDAVDQAHLPHIFIEVIRKGSFGSERISYFRVECNDLITTGTDRYLLENGSYRPKWQLLNKDLYQNLNGFPGFMLCSVRVDKAETLASEPRRPLSEFRKRKYCLVAHVYQGKEIPIADSNGMSDPFCIVRCGALSMETSWKPATLFPTWYQTLRGDVELPFDPEAPRGQNLRFAPDISLFVYDHDQLASDDFLGRTHIPILSVTQQCPERPTWYKLFEEDPSNTEGEVLVSFQLWPADEPAPPIPASLRPPMKDCTLEITVLGLRGLIPAKMSRLNNPYLEINCGDKDQSRTTPPSREPSPYNPNYGKIIQTYLQLPIDPLYAPCLCIYVFDRFLGFRRSVGTGVIPLSAFLPWLEGDDALLRHRYSTTDLGEEPEEEEEEEPPADTAAVVRRASVAAVARPSIAAAPVRPAKDILKPEDEQRLLQPADDQVELKSLNLEQEADSSAPAVQLTVQEPEEDDVPKDKVVADEARAADAPGEEEMVEELEEYLIQRPVVHTDLEKTFPTPSPFHEFKLFRGQSRGLNFLQKALGTGGIQQVGLFKGFVRVYEGREPPKTTTEGPAIRGQKDLKPRAVVVRVYVLKAYNLIPQDNGYNDPYLQLELGKEKISDRENKLRNQKDRFVDLFRSFEFHTTLPGTSLLKVTVRDWDLIMSDSDIGATTIDLENRIFHPEWKALAAGNAKLPVERRRLMLPTSARQQGQLDLWVDILTPDKATGPMIDIHKPPPEPFFLRLSAWSARDLTIKDPVTEQNDPFVRCTFTAVDSEGQLKEETQESDTHWRAKNQIGNFNWRFVFELRLPYRRLQRLNIQVYDKDVIGSNDLIGETTFPMKQILKRALFRYRQARKKKGGAWPDSSTMVHFPAEKQQSAGLGAGLLKKKAQVGKQWIKLWAIDPDTRQPNCEGELELEFDIMHKDVHEMVPAAIGRDEPNQAPMLPEPDRFHFSFLHPFDSLIECLGPSIAKKVILAVCCAGCLTTFIYFLPYIFQIMVEVSIQKG